MVPPETPPEPQSDPAGGLDHQPAGTSGSDILIPQMHFLDDLHREQMKVVHLQPDDVLIFSNVGDLDPEDINLDALKTALGGRTLVFFHGPIDLDQLRDISGGCACCGHKGSDD